MRPRPPDFDIPVGDEQLPPPIRQEIPFLITYTIIGGGINLIEFRDMFLVAVPADEENPKETVLDAVKELILLDYGNSDEPDEGWIENEVDDLMFDMDGVQGQVWRLDGIREIPTADYQVLKKYLFDITAETVGRRIRLKN